MHAQDIPYNQLFRVNNTSESEQVYSRACKLLNNGYVICWDSFGPESDPGGIYAQIYNKDRSIRISEFLVNTDVETRKDYPHIAKLSDDGFVICWQSYEQDGSGEGIFAQIFNSDGTKRGFEIQVNTTIIYDQWRPVVTGIDDGGFIIFWESQIPGDTVFINTICGQKFTSAGTKVGDEFQVPSSSVYDHHFLSITNVANNSFILYWEVNESLTNNYWTYCQMFNASGQEVGAEIIISSNSIMPDICWIDNNGLLVSYRRYDSEGSHIYGKIYNNTLTESTDEFRITSIASEPLDPHKVTKIDGNGFIVCWNDGIEEDIRLQFFSNDGSKHGPEYKVYDNLGEMPEILCIDSSNFMVIWTDDHHDEYDWNIYAKYYPIEKKRTLLPYNLLKPKNDINVNLLSQEFKWKNSCVSSEYFPWELEYNLNISDDINFTNPINIESIYDTTYFFQNLEPGIRYYWKVLAKNWAGDSLWSDKSYSFFVSQSLIPFSLIEPKMDETVQFINPSFQWNHASGQSFSSPWELEYQMYIDQNDDFSDPQIYSITRDTVFSSVYLSPGTTYYWKVLAKDSRNDSLWSSEINLFFVSEDATVSIEDQIAKTKSQTLELYSNYPNPFNPETTIKYNLPVDQSVYSVKIKLYDALGRLITTLKDESQNPGMHTVKWNGKNLSGLNMPSGIYFCVVQAGPCQTAQKMLLVR
jgi:hypothetical protein